MNSTFRISLLIGAFAIFSNQAFAAEVPRSMILKTPAQTWEINPSRLDLFSDYNKSYFGGLEVAVEGQNASMLDSFVDQSNVEGLDSMKIRRYLESRIAPDIFREKTDVAIDMDEEGKITFEGTGLFGRKLDIEAATRLFEHALLNDITYVNLPLIKEEPVVTILNDKLKEMGIIEQVSGGETDFSNSPGNRIVNINVGLSKFEGHLVKPGEEFVFGSTLGPVDGSTGYRKELVIKGPKTVPEYGGGLCQVSTTAYRAVLAAGYPITDRRNHSYAVSYYKPLGLDATVYPPSVELKFLNDTPHHILMQAFTLGSKSYYNFYGTKTNREVHMIGPYYSGYRSAPPTKIEYSDNLAPGETQVVGHAIAGRNVTWYRHVTYNDEVVLDEATGEKSNKSFLETIFSKYQARPNYYIMGPEKKPVPESEIGG